MGRSSIGDFVCGRARSVLGTGARSVLAIIGVCAAFAAFGSAPVAAQAVDRATFGGIVSEEDGTPVEGVEVELYNQTNLGGRGTFIGVLPTGSDGRYTFVNRNPKCYIVSFQAPADRTIGGEDFLDVGLCVEAGDVVEDLNATLDAIVSETGIIQATILTDDLEPVVGAAVELYAKNEDGSRGDLVAGEATDDSGRSVFVAAIDCYLLNFVAPEGQFFDGGPNREVEACATIGDVSVFVATLDGAPVETATAGGTVINGDGSPAVGVKIDLFAANPDGSRGSFLGFAISDADGRFGFEVDPGCHVLTYIAPEGETFNGSRWFQPNFCIEANEVISDLDAALDSPVDPEDDITLGGLVVLGESPMPGVKIDIFRQGDGGGRAGFLGFATTGDDGRFSFVAEAGCFVLTYIAPADTTFNGSRWFQPSTCVEAGGTNDALDATLQSTADNASVGGTISDAAGSPVEGVKVTYWGVLADGSRGAFAGRAFSNADGVFSKDVPSGCHWLVYVAPEGASFGGTPFQEAFRCVESGEVVTDLDASLD